VFLGGQLPQIIHGAQASDMDYILIAPGLKAFAERLNGSSKRKSVIAVEGHIQVVPRQSMTHAHFDCLQSVQNY